MDRIKRKKPEFRRIAAMIMAAAMIISVIPFPEGLFHVTAAAAVKMSATWTAANSTLTDSDDAEAASVKAENLPMIQAIRFRFQEQPHLQKGIVTFWQITGCLWTFRL